MRGTIVVEKPEDYKKWVASQKPEYYTLFPDKDPTLKAADSAKAPLAAVTPKASQIIKRDQKKLIK